MSRGETSERGAVAVEFALIFPVLIVILLGIVEFGSVLNAQLLVTAAAREGARAMSLSGSPAQAQAAALDAATGLVPALTTADVTISSPSCTAGADVTVTVSYAKPSLTGLFGTSMSLTGTATRLCFG